jgi:hypothetical protein
MKEIRLIRHYCCTRDSHVCISLARCPIGTQIGCAMHVGSIPAGLVYRRCTDQTRTKRASTINALVPSLVNSQVSSLLMRPLLDSASCHLYLCRPTYPVTITRTVLTPISILLPPHQDRLRQTTPASDLLAFPHKQQPLSQPPGVGISMSSAAVVVGSDQGL